MITELTEEQIAKFPEYVDRWCAIGLNTDPCSVEVCRPIINRAYEVANLAPPSTIVLVDSPRAGVEKGLELFGDKYTRQELLQHQIFGFQDAYWLSYYEYLLKELNLECCEKLRPLMELAEVCGWWAPYEDYAIIQHRPTEINLQDGVLHCDDGPAVLYRDGFSVWALEGVRVDEQIIMHPETQTIDQMRREENLEVKRLRIGRYGWTKYLEEVGAKVLDQRRNDVDKTKEVLLKGDDMVVLICTCISTGRMYPLEVPGEITTCEGAQKWLGPSEGVCIGAS